MSYVLIYKLALLASLFGVGTPGEIYSSCRLQAQRTCKEEQGRLACVRQLRQGCATRRRWHETAACLSVCASWHLGSAAGELAYARSGYGREDVGDLLAKVRVRVYLCDPT